MGVGVYVVHVTIISPASVLHYLKQNEPYSCTSVREYSVNARVATAITGCVLSTGWLHLESVVVAIVEKLPQKRGQHR